VWPPFFQGAGSATRAANLAVGDLAVAEWHGRATSIADGPYDNDYCWVIRVAEDRIVEVRAYFDSALVEELFRTTER
jgi:uncharacterized protein